MLLQTSDFSFSLRTLFPNHFIKETFFGFELWQCITFGIILVLAVLLFKMLTPLSRIILVWFINLAKIGVFQKEQFIPSIKSFNMLLIACGVKMLMPLLELNKNYTHYINSGFIIILPLISIVLVFRLIDLISIEVKHLAQKPKSTINEKVIPIVRKTCKAGLAIALILFIMDNLGYNIKTLLAGLSLGGVVVAFAAQDTIKNFFGSIMILLDKPFELGDLIKFGEVEGIVEEIGIRSTRLRTLNDSVVYVPNGGLADKVIDNLGMRNARKFSLTLNCCLDTTLERINLFTETLKKSLAVHPMINPTSCDARLSAINDHALQITITLFINTKDASLEAKTKEEILISALELTQTIGIKLIRPSMDVALNAASPETKIALNQSILNAKEFSEEFKKRFAPHELPA